MDTLTPTQRQLVYLMACALHRTAPRQELLGPVDWEALYTLSKEHCVGAMVAMALEQSPGLADPATASKWREEENRAIRRAMLMDGERQHLLAALDEAGIWHMSLKGCVLKDWYPRYGMREMSDNDILIDPTRREQVRQLFLSRGYEAETYGRSNHDVYLKPPVFHFEMHGALFSDSLHHQLAQHYKGVQEKLLPVEGQPWEYRFSPEDFYVFVNAHAYKHYHRGGIGIRSLADEYVMNRTLGDCLNRQAVSRELEALGIGDYEATCRSLSHKLFGEPLPLGEAALTAREQQMLLYCLQSNTYGNLGNKVSNSLRDIQREDGPIRLGSKIRYCLLRLFPGQQWCKENYPFFYRHPRLLPLLWVWRLCWTVPSKLGRALRELRTLCQS